MCCERMAAPIISDVIDFAIEREAQTVVSSLPRA
jgi:hypothetical protein